MSKIRWFASSYPTSLRKPQRKAKKLKAAKSGTKGNKKSRWEMNHHESYWSLNLVGCSVSGIKFALFRWHFELAISGLVSFNLAVKSQQCIITLEGMGGMHRPFLKVWYFTLGHNFIHPNSLPICPSHGAPVLKSKKNGNVPPMPFLFFQMDVPETITLINRLELRFLTGRLSMKKRVQRSLYPQSFLTFNWSRNTYCRCPRSKHVFFEKWSLIIIMVLICIGLFLAVEYTWFAGSWGYHWTPPYLLCHCSFKRNPALQKWMILQIKCCRISRISCIKIAFLHACDGFNPQISHWWTAIPLFFGLGISRICSETPPQYGQKTLS